MSLEPSPPVSLSEVCVWTHTDFPADFMSSPTLCHTLSLLPSPLSGPSLGRFSVTISLVVSGLDRWLGPGFSEDPLFFLSP